MTNLNLLSGYTIVSWSCLGYNIVFWSCFCFSNIFHFFHFLKLFSFTLYFPSLKFSRCLPQKITSRYTIVWFVWRVRYCVLLLSWGHDFLVSFIWNSQKCPVSQNIWCLIKTQLKNITQEIFQGGSPWATLTHNSVVCLEGTLLCPAAFLRSWFFDVFQSFPLPFPLLKFFLLINYFLSFFHLKFSEMPSFPKYMVP